MSNLTLYDISKDYLQALDAFTDPDADIPLDAAIDTLEGIEGQLQDKAVNVAKFMQNLDATAKAIREAEQQMAKRRKAIENRAQWLRDYLKLNMEAAQVLASPETKQRFAALGMEGVGGSPESFARFLQAETEKWAAVIRAAHIHAQ